MVPRIFGDRPVAGGPDDLMALVQQADPRSVPALRIWCGSEDYLLADNLLFRDTCVAAGLRVTTSISPGEHEWGYWDDKIQEVLAWLPLAR